MVDEIMKQFVILPVPYDTRFSHYELFTRPLHYCMLFMIRHEYEMYHLDASL